MELLNCRNLRGLTPEGYTWWKEVIGCHGFYKLCVGLGRGIGCCYRFKEELTCQETTVVGKNPPTTISRKEEWKVRERQKNEVPAVMMLVPSF